MARRPIAQTSADAQARAVGNANGALQAQALQSPALRRSQYLADALEKMRTQTPDIRSGGQLAAELLAQGITQFAKNRADKQVGVEANERLESQIGGGSSTLARLLGTVPEPTPQAARLGAALLPPAPAAPPVQPMPMTDPMAGPVTPPAAPMAALAPPQAESPPMAAPQAQAPTPQPNGPTPGEAAYIRAGLESRDPARVAEARSMLASIEQRMIAPPEFEITNVNGVPYRVDPQTGIKTPLFEGGLPQEAMNQNRTVDAANEFGLPQGSGVSVDPFNRPSVIAQPQQGYERVGGQLRPEAGGSADLNNPNNAFNALRDIRTEVRPVLDQATQLQRNINALRSGVRQQNGAGDIAAINGLQKLIDEGVVREGDVALQLQAQGIQGGIAGLTGYITSTGRFSPQIRAQLLAAGEDIYKNVNQIYGDRIIGYRNMVDRTFGQGAFEDVVPTSTLEAFGFESAPRPVPRDPRPQSRPRTAGNPAPPARSAAPRANGVTRRYNPNTGSLE